MRRPVALLGVALLPIPVWESAVGNSGVAPSGLSAAGALAEPAQKPPRVSLNLQVFWVTCMLTLVASHYSLASSPRLPWLYRILAVVIVALTPLTAGFLQLLAQRPVQYLVAFATVLVVGSLIGFSGSPGELFSTTSEPVVWLRAFPFLLCGFTLSRWPAHERKWLMWTVGIMAVLAIPDVHSFLRGSLAGLNRADIFVDDKRGERLIGILTSYVNLAPAYLLLAIVALRVYGGKRDARSWVTTLAMIPLLMIPLVAGFTAPALLFFVAIGSAIFALPVRNLVYRLQLAGIGAMAIVAVWLMLAWGSSSLGGAVRQVYNRLESVRRAVVLQEVTKDTNVATSGRLELAKHSLQTFLRYPLFGAGGGDNAEQLGGHSYFIDTLARFGIVGSLPMFLAFLSLLWRAVQLRRSGGNRWAAAADVVFMITWLTALVINPYFLGYLTLNYIVFLGFGLICGDYFFRDLELRRGRRVGGPVLQASPGRGSRSSRDPLPCRRPSSV